MAVEEVFAVAIGMPMQTARWGLSIASGHVSVNDPVGNTDGQWAVRPFNLVYTDRWGSWSRYWGEVFYQEVVLPAGVSQIGQFVSQYGGRLSLQRRLDIKAELTPWVGAGLQLSNSRFRDRHTIDVDGFLDTSYPQRSEFQSSLLLNVTFDKRLNRRWDVGAKVEQVVPIGDGVSESMISLIFLYSL